jgi:hypothetical protein
MNKFAGYERLAAFLLAVLAVYLIVKDRPDEGWLLPATLVFAAFLLLLRPRVFRAFRTLTFRLQMWSDAPAVAAQRSSLLGERATLLAQLTDGRRRSVERYWEGLEEGLTRAAAAAISPRAEALPVDLQLAPGETEPTVIGRSLQPEAVPIGGRATLVVLGTLRPVGVLVMRDVSLDGVVVMTCVDPLWRDFWANPPTESTKLDAYKLIPYDHEAHHTTRPILLQEEDSA